MDLVDALDRSFAHAHDVVAGVRPDQYDDKTPCAEWTVRELLEHMIGVVAGMGAATSGRAPEPFTLSADPAAQIREAASSAMAGWRTPGVLDRLIDAGPGPMPGQALAGINLLDTATHTWDLAIATGQSSALPDEVATVALEASRSIVNDDLRPGRFGAEVPVAAGATPTRGVGGVPGSDVVTPPVPPGPAGRRGPAATVGPMAERRDGNLFDEAGELLRLMAPDGLGELRFRAHRRGLKAWFGPAKPTREHYEAQLIPRTFAVGGDGSGGGAGLVLEVGFHAEHGDEAANQAVADRLDAGKAIWAGELGASAQLDTFLGRDSWRRLSEVWDDIGVLDEDPEAPFEIACRLVDYMSVLEPIRLGG